MNKLIFTFLATPTEESQTDGSFNANSSQQVCYFEKINTKNKIFMKLINSTQNGVDESEEITKEDACEDKKETEDEVMEPPPEPAPSDDHTVNDESVVTAPTDDGAISKFDDDFVTLESSAKESYA